MPSRGCTGRARWHRPRGAAPGPQWPRGGPPQEPCPTRGASPCGSTASREWPACEQRTWSPRRNRTCLWTTEPSGRAPSGPSWSPFGPSRGSPQCGPGTPACRCCHRCQTLRPGSSPRARRAWVRQARQQAPAPLPGSAPPVAPGLAKSGAGGQPAPAAAAAVGPAARAGTRQGRRAEMHVAPACAAWRAEPQQAQAPARARPRA
mmetsp:Transcript_20383/g.78312  ORF Transcript_20383/g.78312 Transcript_20383/m.78312 type:complete len:205 (+) Transcript_20383:453-1067(+)